MIQGDNGGHFSQRNYSLRGEAPEKIRRLCQKLAFIAYLRLLQSRKFGIISADSRYINLEKNLTKLN